MDHSIVLKSIGISIANPKLALAEVIANDGNLHENGFFSDNKIVRSLNGGLKYVENEIMGPNKTDLMLHVSDDSSILYTNCYLTSFSETKCRSKRMNKD